MEELIKPNWHVALVHFPIALLGLGALLELLSFLGWRRSSVRLGARWMILAGALLAVPATFSGLYALHEEAPQGIAVLAEADPVLARQLTYHVWTQAAATVAAMLVVTLWIGLSDGLRDRLSVFFKLVLLGTVGVMAYGSHLGGQQVYEHGFAVHPTTAPATLPTAGELRSIDIWATLFPPDQLHVTVAGFAMAAACVCLGLSARGTHFDEMTEVEQRLQIASAFARQDTLPIEGDAYKPYVSHINHTPSVRAGRLWTLAWVTLLAASISGLLIIALDENVFRPSPFSLQRGRSIAVGSDLQTHGRR